MVTLLFVHLIYCTKGGLIVSACSLRPEILIVSHPPSAMQLIAMSSKHSCDHGEVFLPSAMQQAACHFFFFTLTPDLTFVATWFHPSHGHVTWCKYFCCTTQLDNFVKVSSCCCCCYSRYPQLYRHVQGVITLSLILDMFVESVFTTFGSVRTRSIAIKLF